MTLPVMVLASGGLDSTTCLAYYLEQGVATSAIWIDYGQRAARAEEGAIERITAYYNVPLQKIAVQGIAWTPLTTEPFEFRGRNFTFVAIALNMTPLHGGLIALGIHGGTIFQDCSPTFAEQLDQLVALLSDQTVRFDSPFLRWTKEEIAQYAVTHHVPIHLTYSCERGTVPPCKECIKCQDDAVLREILENGSASRGNVP